MKRTSQTLTSQLDLPVLSPEQFAALRDLLAQESGVYLDSARQRVLENGLARRLTITGVSLGDYLGRVHGGSGRDELRRLSELVLNHETFFFRNRPHMRALQDVLLEEVHRRKPIGAPIRIWSAGCATGEEAYSLAIAACETAGRLEGRSVEIWATDLSATALVQAQTGHYRGRAIANLTPDLLARYFQPHGAGYLVGPTLRSMVRFAQLNLLDPLPIQAQGMDIVFCQNVMIYFQLETCRAVLARIYESMAP